MVEPRRLMSAMGTTKDNKKKKGKKKLKKEGSLGDGNSQDSGSKATSLSKGHSGKIKL